MLKTFCLFLIGFFISCRVPKTAAVSPSNLLPVVINFESTASPSEEKRSYFEQCVAVHKIKIITLEEGLTLARNNAREILLTTNNSGNNDEMVRRLSDDAQPAFNNITFKFTTDASDTGRLTAISFTVTALPPNKYTKKPVIHLMPAEWMREHDWTKAVKLTVDSLFNTGLLK